jgi:hypothetical protein
MFYSGFITGGSQTNIYDATNDICFANTGSQRLAQTNEPIKPNLKFQIVSKKHFLHN